LLRENKYNGKKDIVKDISYQGQTLGDLKKLLQNLCYRFLCLPAQCGKRKTDWLIYEKDAL